MGKRTIYERAVEAAEAALIDLYNKGQQRPKGRELLQWVLKNAKRFDGDVQELKASWGPSLTRAVGDPNTRIMREPNEYGFRLAEAVAPEEEEEESEEESPSERTYDQREHKLYAVLADWLSSRGYNAKDTSSAKKGGPWGNPDVVGLAIIDHPLGHQDLEIATIEVKVSLTNWQREIFEAVSHRRFAHRAYFAFAVGDDEPAVEKLKQARELREYGERFGIGVLAVFMDADDYRALTKGTGIKSWDLELESIRVEVVWPALYSHVPSNETSRFLKDTLGLSSSQQVQRFGIR